MRRCPCCNARLSEACLCSRCGADLSLAMRCEKAAKEWLSVALRMLCANQPRLAALAVNRSLSFKQTQVAHLFRKYLVEQQYIALYQCLRHEDWVTAQQALTVLRSLQGENEALLRFGKFIEHSSAENS